MLNIDPADQAPRALSYAPGDTFTHRHVYCVELPDDLLAPFLFETDQHFKLVDLMGVNKVLLQARCELGPLHFLQHCVVRTAHGWHLANPAEDFQAVVDLSAKLWKAGASRVTLVTAVNPTGVDIPSELDAITRRTDAMNIS